MFYCASDFNQKLIWNTRKVQDKSFMFNYATNINKELFYNF